MSENQKRARQYLVRLCEHIPGIRWLLHKIRLFDQRIAALESIPPESTSREFWKKVDLLDFGPLSVFMYVDDLAYQNTVDHVRNYSIAAHIKKMEQKVPLTDGKSIKPDRLNLLPYICQHYAKQHLSYHFLDIGCQYGAYSLYVAHIFRELGWQNQIVAFDIGVARHLVDYNIQLNQQSETVKFEPLAVSNHCYPTIVYTELGHSENNRVVNRDLSSEYESYVVSSTSIDQYLAAHNIDDNIVIKVDAQGGEFEIMKGMEKCLAQRYVTGLFEFTPHALVSRVSPLDFLRELGNEAIIIDVPPDRESIRVIEAEMFSAFTDEVANREIQQTDVLRIPKNLPGAYELCRELVDGING